MEITTIEQAKKLGFDTYQYLNGDWKYEDAEGYEHLFRDGVELTEGIVTKMVYSYPCRGWKYLDKQGFWHKFDNNGKKIGE